MDILSAILDLAKNIASASSAEIWLKLVFGAFLAIFGVVYLLYKRKSRGDVADANRDDDIADDVVDNRRTETQNSQDGQSVRDRLRGPNE
jgi:cbb3-type cytochrome oxidase subunit 3